MLRRSNNKLQTRRLMTLLVTGLCVGMGLVLGGGSSSARVAQVDSGPLTGSDMAVTRLSPTATQRNAKGQASVPASDRSLNVPVFGADLGVDPRIFAGSLGRAFIRGDQ